MKSRFGRLSLREQWMVLVLAVAVAFAWQLCALGRFAILRRAYGSVIADRSEHSMWLSNKASIEARVALATHSLVAEKTYSANRLFAEVNTLAQGLHFDIGDQQTEDSGDVAIHSVRLQIQKTDLSAVGRFYEGLKARAPYLGLESCELSIDRSGPGKVNVVLKIFSIDLLSHKSGVKS